MVKIAATFFFAALVAIPAFANSAQQYQREFDLDNIVVTREDLNTIFGREFVNDVEARSPFGLGLLFKGVKALTHLGHHHHNNNQRRDLIDEEDFYARDLSTDIEEREPFGLGLLFKGVKALTHLGHHHHNNNQRRDLTEEEEFYARGLSGDLDLEEREPFGLGLLFKGVKALTHLGHHHHNNNQRRDLAEEEEFDARDLSGDLDLEEREPFGLGLLFKGVKALTHLGHHHHNNNQRRELDSEDDLFEREFTEELLDELD
jgi:hypothetical protein